MKKKKRRIEITVKTDRVLTIRQRQARALAWCERCAQQVQMAPGDEAAATAGVTARTLYRWVEDGKIHFVEMADGSVWVCLESVPKSTSAREPRQ